MERLKNLLMQGRISASELAAKLGISRSTLSRLILAAQKAGLEICRIGKGPATSYALKRSVSTRKSLLPSEVPLYKVDSTGNLKPIARLSTLHQSQYLISPPEKILEGLPPEFLDMAPQGFIGRMYAKQHSEELALPTRLEDWSNDHILIALAKRGEDLPGQFILGEESAERCASLSYESTDKNDSLRFAREALEGLIQGSSAGGEQPKFTKVFGGEHYIVKFVDNVSHTGTRWRDLLICEHVALKTLASAGFEVAETEFYEIKEKSFLKVRRFDRLGLKGRRAFLSFAAVSAHLGKTMESWGADSEHLVNSGLLSVIDAKKIRLIEAFCRFIHDSDRHFYNLAFFPTYKKEDPLQLAHLELAPLFDKLPMSLAPISAKATTEYVLEKDLVSPIPTPELFDVWEEARLIAIEFWRNVKKEKLISKKFHAIADKYLIDTAGE